MDLSFKNKLIDKYIKIVSNQGRIIIGKCQCIDNSGTIYLLDTVEVFDNNSEYKSLFTLFENTDQYQLYFNTDKYTYQIYGDCIIPFNEIDDILVLKD